jgi:hypothetical protein
MSQQLTLEEFLKHKVVGHETQALEPLYLSSPLPRVRTPAWVFDKEQRITEDFTAYLQQNMGVSLEMEYNPKKRETCSHSWASEISNERNMIWNIHEDCTLRHGGQEFVISALPIRSEEFATRLPIKVFRDHFETGPQCSIHTHAIVLPYGNHKPIPIAIAKNAWQLFRAYYPGWVYLFGNYKGRMLRSNWATWRESYTASPLSTLGWHERVACGEKRSHSGLAFDDCITERDTHYDPVTGEPVSRFRGIRGLPTEIEQFDAEIRVSDSTMELDQIVALRALTKALFVRAADLANVGVIDLSPRRSREALDITRDIEQSIGDRYSTHHGEYISGPVDMSLEERRGPIMKRIALAFYNEVRPYLTPFEKRNVKSCLIRPVRHRGVVLGY